MRKLLRQRPLTMEAFKYETQEDARRIIADAESIGLIANPTGNLYVGDGRNPLYSIQIHTRDGYFYVRPGFWVVFYGQSFQILTEEEIHDRYEEV